MLKRITFMIFMFFLLPASVLAIDKNATIKGHAINHVGGLEEEVLVYYFDNGNKIETKTNANGEYQIRIPLNSEGTTIFFQKQGYRTSALNFYQKNDYISVIDDVFQYCFDERKFNTIEALESDIFNGLLYPFAGLTIFSDEEVIAKVSYLKGEDCGGKKNETTFNDFKKKQGLANAIPLSQDTEVKLITKANKEFSVNVINDKLGSSIKVCKRGNKISYNTCEGGNCSVDCSKSFFGRLIDWFVNLFR